MQRRRKFDGRENESDKKPRAMSAAELLTPFLMPTSPEEKTGMMTKIVWRKRKGGR